MKATTMSTSTACSSHQFNANTHESNTWVLSALSLCPRRRRRSIQPEASTLSLVPVEKTEGLPRRPPTQDNAETAPPESAIPIRGIPCPDQRKLFVEAEPDINVTKGNHSVRVRGQVRTLDFTLGQLPMPRHCLHNPTSLSAMNGYPADMPWICTSDSMGCCALSPRCTMPSSNGAGNSSSSHFTLHVVDEDRPLLGLAPLHLEPNTSSAMSDTMSDSGQCWDSDMDSHSHSDLADLGSSMENDNVVSSSIIVDNKYSSENMEVQSSYKGHPNPSNLLELSSSLGTSSSPPPPRKIGLSQFYAGKSRSFSCLGDVVSLADVVKPENPYAKKRKYNNAISSFDRTSQLPPLQKDVATVSKKSLLINDGKGCQRGIVASRSYSFSDLQGVGTQFSPC